MKYIFKNINFKWVFSVTLTSFALLFFVNRTQYVQAISESNKPYKELKIFSEVLHNVQSNYVDEIYPDKLIEGAINGMLRTLDAHSSYLPKDMYREMQIETDGEFGGLGIEITLRDGILTIVSPIEGTPAFIAGVKSGDKIVKVDGVLTKGLSLNEAVAMMRGRKGTKVTITVAREGMKSLTDFEIIRDIIKIKSVKFKKITNDIGYVRISNFSKSTGSDLGDALAELEKNQMTGIILDLRFNPGGLLSQAVEVAEKFMKKGSLIVYTKGKRENQNFRFTANSNKVYDKYPLVILVNAGSASASEIVAGALQDTKRAAILGTQTFGKGSVQTILQLSDGSGLRLTTAKYYTPSGKVIHGNGIAPDIIVEERLIDKKDKNNDRPRALREKDIEKHLNAKKSAIKKEKKEDEKNIKSDETVTIIDEEDEKLKNDAQLQSAISLLKGWHIFKNSVIN